jgi:hypothetical protein
MRGKKEGTHNLYMNGQEKRYSGGLINNGEAMATGFYDNSDTGMSGGFSQAPLERFRDMIAAVKEKPHLYRKNGQTPAFYDKYSQVQPKMIDHCYEIRQPCHTANNRRCDQKVQHQFNLL